MGDHLIVNVEEQLAKRLHDGGFVSEARKAIVAASSLPNGRPFDELQHSRRVPVTKKEEQELAALEKTNALADLRSERDARLAASDWTQLPDVPAEKQKAWAAYRQKLRDLPANTKEPRNPDWPEPPT